MIEEFVSRVFATRNALHLKHWATTSYAAHVALGELYDGIIGKIDDVVEMYQGAVDIIGEVKLATVKGDLTDHLREEADWIEANMEEISGGIKAVENALQDLTGLYYRTVYKLTRFK